MTARFQETVGYRAGDRLTFCNLADFPHEGLVGQNKHRLFYRVPPGIEVLAYDEAVGSLTFRPATVWSHHKDLVIEIANLASGKQIVADDDPRAVYGLDPDTLTYKRSSPSESVGMFVPVGADFSDIKEDLRAVPFPRYVGGKTKQMHPFMPLTESSGRVLGTLAGDGWVVQCEKRGIVGVALAALDPGIVKTFEEDINTWFLDPVHLGCVDRTGGDFGPEVQSTRYTLSSIPLGTFVNDMVGKLARNKHLPPFFLTAPRAFRLGLLAGLIDTDGSISVSNAKNKPQWMINYASNSLRLCQEIVWLAKSLSVSASISTSKTPGGEPCWIVSFSAPEFHKLQEMPCVHTEKKVRFQRFFSETGPNDESGAYTRHNLVPLPLSLSEYLRGFYPNKSKQLNNPKYKLSVKEREKIASDISTYMTLFIAKKNGYTSRSTARNILAAHPLLRESNNEVLQRWIKLVDNDTVRWDRVTSYERTEIVEDGYDLTVPGHETFMNVEGVVLSNTMQVHFPITQGGVEDAKKMTMSHLLLSDQGRDQLLAFPQHEAIIGVTHASNFTPQAGATVHKFKTVEDAKAAYRRGDIKLSDSVEITG